MKGESLLQDCDFQVHQLSFKRKHEKTKAEAAEICGSFGETGAVWGESGVFSFQEMDEIFEEEDFTQYASSSEHWQASFCV